MAAATIDPLSGLPLEDTVLKPGKALRAAPRAIVREVLSDRVFFDLVNAGAGVANALCRLLLEEVPSLAARYVTVRRNTTGILRDRHLAMKLGLFAVRLKGGRDPLTSLNMYHECPCDGVGCERCTVKFRVRARAGNKCENVYVTSKDCVFEPRADGLEFEVVDVQRPELQPLLRHVVPEERRGAMLCLLTGSGEIDLDVEATLGTGFENARYVACVPTFRPSETEPDVVHCCIEATGGLDARTLLRYGMLLLHHRLRDAGCLPALEEEGIPAGER